MASSKKRFIASSKGGKARVAQLTLEDRRKMGFARAAALTPERRREIARMGAAASNRKRWGPPKAAAGTEAAA